MYFKLEFGKPKSKGVNPDFFIPFGTTPDSSTLKTLLSIFGGQSLEKFDCTTITGQQKAYDKVEIVQTIIDRKGDYLTRGKLKYYSGDKEVETGADYKALQKLMNNPNPMQSGDEFDKMVNAYTSIFGFCLFYRVYPTNRNTGIPSAVWCVNPLTLKYELTGKLYNQSELKNIVKYVEFSAYNGFETIRLEGDQLNDLWMFNYGGINKDNLFTAQSPLFSLSDQCSLFAVGVNAYGQLIKRSILGLVTNRTKDGAAGWMPMSDDDKKDVQEKLNRYGLIESRDQIIISDKDLFYQSMLSNVGNLQIPEALKIAVSSFCNRLNFQIELLSQREGTYENKNAAEKAQYQNQVIPFANSYYNQLSQFLNPSGTVVVLREYDDLPIFQENEKEKAEVNAINIETFGKLFREGMITKNQYLQSIGEMPVDGGDVYISELENIPLAVKIGVGGTQSLQMVLTDANLTLDQKINILIVVFGMSEPEAKQIMS